MISVALGIALDRLSALETIKVEAAVLADAEISKLGKDRENLQQQSAKLNVRKSIPFGVAVSVATSVPNII